MIDVHTHILPGFDDGVRSTAEACELAGAVQSDGAEAIVATPHVSAEYPTTAEEMERGVERLRRDLAAAGLSIGVLPGGEVGLETLTAMTGDELYRFSLGRGRYVLVHFPEEGWPLALDGAMHRLDRLGLATVLAHPERNESVRADPGVLRGPVRTGALVQVTAASLTGRRGRWARRTAKRLLELGLVHLLASDAHGIQSPDSLLGAASRAVGDDDLAVYLTSEAPAAVLAGEPVAEVPRIHRRRFASL